MKKPKKSDKKELNEKVAELEKNSEIQQKEINKLKRKSKLQKWINLGILFDN